MLPDVPGTVDHAIAASDNQGLGTDPLLLSIRKAMTTVQAAGDEPNTLILTPANSETHDTLVSGITGADKAFEAAAADA